MKIKSYRIIRLMLFVVLIFLVIAGIMLAVIKQKNVYTIEVATNSDAISFEYGDEVVLPDIDAKVSGSIFLKNGKLISPEISDNDSDFSKLGEHKVIYTYSYKDVKTVYELTVLIQDKTAPIITLKYEDDHFTSPVGSYEEEGFVAFDDYDGDITTVVESYEDNGFVYYSVVDSSGNRAEAKREIIYKDVISPEITLEGEKETTLEAGAIFVEPGFSAVDECDGDITKDVIVSGEIDNTVLGDNTLTYSVKDSSGNEASVERVIKVIDTEGPAITVAGGLKQFILVDSEYNDSESYANDVIDGDCSDTLKVEGEVDTSKTGVYKLNYTAEDKSGNISSCEKTVYVYNSFTEVETVSPGEKVVYLTFDDGPGQYTEKLLDILDKYNVKVTFFVTNQSSGYQDLISEEYRRGHTVAIHSYSHNYSNVYSSEEAYIADLIKMSDVIEEKTGEIPRIFRFPGGSSNTVSASYSKGIMRELANTLTEMGYKYADWNVSSGDAGGAIPTEKVVKNVTNGIAKNPGASVVLQHDVHEFSVDAVEEIILWGLANGYTFLPMDLSSPMAHHGINN